MRFVNLNVLSAADTASATGIQVDSNQLIAASFHFYFGDSTAAGTVQVQASNDPYQDHYQASNFTVVHWANIPSASATITAGASAIIQISDFSYRWLRVIYTSSSGGSSTVTCNMFATSI